MGLLKFPLRVIIKLGFPGDLVVKNPPAMQEMWVHPLGHKDHLKKEMVIFSSNLAWNWASLETHLVKNLPAVRETWV